VSCVGDIFETFLNFIIIIIPMAKAAASGFCRERQIAWVTSGIKLNRWIHSFLKNSLKNSKNVSPITIVTHKIRFTLKG
jgi:hypothetical protein